jgi:hypothetical protein
MAITNGSSMECAPGTVVTPVQHVVHATRGGETVLLDVRRGQYYTLNEVGSRVWALVCEGASVTAIEERIREEYDASPERVRADISALISRLVREALVTCDAR